MLKIQRKTNGDVVLTLSGRLEAANVSELSALLAAEPAGRAMVLDLKDVVLVDATSSASCGRAKATASPFATVRRTSGPGSSARSSRHSQTQSKPSPTKGDEAAWQRKPN